mmetsp:Transcript_4526/g.10681  ORF Transcript_4526/g.10681 Transcript_4526/m.10681 type:complete len:403 (+) Transcript_4526:146-1354(+)
MALTARPTPAGAPLPCVPWQLFRGSGSSAAASAPAQGSRQAQPREHCRVLSDSVDALAALAGENCGTDAGSSSGANEARAASLSEEVHDSLQAVVRQLQNVKEDAGSSVSEAREAILHLLATDVQAKLVVCLDALNFEARKDTMRLFGAVLRLGPLVGANAEVIEYVQTHPRIAQLLLEGSGRPEVFCHCAQMLRCCTRFPQLVAFLYDQNAMSRLIDLARHQTFDISTEAFCSLRELLLAHKDVSAAHLQAHFEECFELYNSLLQADDYVVQRQALRLLGQVLLDRSFMQVMVAYVGNERFMQIHMNLLRDKSKAIQLEAFHVFKIFVANPNKPPRVQHILYRNKERLVKVLETVAAKRQSDKSLAQDLGAVVGIIQALEAPSPLRAGPTEAQPESMVAVA